MLLTIKQPSQQHSFKSFYDYTPPTPPSTSRFSPTVASGSYLPPISSSSQHSHTSASQSMSTPHRGLPPPAGMSLPQPTPSQPPPPPQQTSQALSQHLGQLPAPPSQQWQGADDGMRNWLAAKAEEDKRKQEEEKTRQETLRLEQRKIEQDMLHTSLQGGIPPYMVPMVFAGMGGGNLANASLEWAQHYMAQAHLQEAQAQQQQQQQQIVSSQGRGSPDQRRESRLTSHPYGAAQGPPILGSTGGQSSTYSQSYQLSPVTRHRQGSLPAMSSRPPQSSHLPRLNTGEIQIQQPPVGGMQILPGQHPLQQSQVAAPTHEAPSSSFIHWQPPATQANSGGNQPNSPSDVTSPRKRKATGPQQAAPPPTSQPQYTSPSFSQGGSSASTTPSGRRRGHSRQRSDLSSRGPEYGRPRRGLSDPQSGLSSSYQRPGPHYAASESREGTPGVRAQAHLPKTEATINEGGSSSFNAPQSNYSAGPEMREVRHSAERERERQQQQQQQVQVQAQAQAQATAQQQQQQHQRRTPPSESQRHEYHPRQEMLKRDDGRD